VHHLGSTVKLPKADFPPVMFTDVNVQSLQAPVAQRMKTVVAFEDTVPRILLSVRFVIGTPFVGIPVGEPLR